MQALRIKQAHRTVSVDLAGDIVSIAIDDQADDTASQLEWSHTLLNGLSVNFEAAEKAVDALGPGWRLPTRRELESLVDLERHDPAIDTDQYPDTQSKTYWTSTPCAWNPESARWVVNFYNGNVGGSGRDSYACVRACRAGQ